MDVRDTEVVQILNAFAGHVRVNAQSLKLKYLAEHPGMGLGEPEGETVEDSDCIYFSHSQRLTNAP